MTQEQLKLGMTGKELLIGLQVLPSCKLSFVMQTAFIMLLRNYSLPLLVTTVLPSRATKCMAHIWCPIFCKRFSKL